MYVCTDREADGAGAFAVAQHTQEAGVLSAGSTGHRHGEETCKKHSTPLNLSRFVSQHVSYMPPSHSLTGMYDVCM